MYIELVTGNIEHNNYPIINQALTFCVSLSSHLPE